MSSEFDLNLASWPSRGRIGFCRGGEASGSYIFLHIATDSRNPEDAFWQAYFEPPLTHEADDEVFVDHASGIMQSFVDEAMVDWAPPELDSEAEYRLFGLRALFGARGSVAYGDDAVSKPIRGHLVPMSETDGFVNSATTGAIFGRANGPSAFGALFRRAREQREFSYADVVADRTIRSRKLAPGTVETLERGGSVDLHDAIYMLQALDYNLAMIPKSASVVLQNVDPWSEFRTTPK